MKSIKRMVGEKLKSEVSGLIGPIGQKPDQESEFTMEDLVAEASNEVLRTCFSNIRDHLKQNEKTFKSWKELYAGMIEGWMDYCQSAVINSQSDKMAPLYVASRVVAASLLLQINKEDTSYAQLCDAWAHRSKSQPPGRKPFREAMTNWINANTDDVMQEVRSLQEEFVVR